LIQMPIPSPPYRPAYINTASTFSPNVVETTVLNDLEAIYLYRSSLNSARNFFKDKTKEEFEGFAKGAIARTPEKFAPGGTR
jgi:hypothetical protein